MKKELFAGLSSLLFPMSMYGLPLSAGGAYQRSYPRAAAGDPDTLRLKTRHTPAGARPATAETDGQLDLQSGRLIRELVIIDAAAPDKHLLRREVKPGVDVVELREKQDGLKQLEAVLARYSGLDAVHIVSHADQGRVQLGGSWLNVNTIKNRVELFASINNAVKEGGDLLFYGCDLAAGEQGEKFLDIIAGNTHADIAASSDKTGSASLGGDWDLEIQRGRIDTEEPFSKVALKDFSSILAPVQYVPDNFCDSVDPACANNTPSHSSSDGHIVFDGSHNIYAYDGIYADAGFYLDYTTTATAGFLQFSADGTNIGSFELTGVNFAAKGGYNCSSADVTGYLVGGGTVSDSFTLSGSGSVTLANLSGQQITRFRVNGSGCTAKVYWPVRIGDFTVDNKQAPNSAPSISIDGTTLAYTEGDAATLIDSAGTVSDADGDTDWNGGSLAAQITANAEAGDRISIADSDGDGTAITISGTDIFSNGVDIGNLSASGGIVTGGTTLTVTFDADATNTNVQEVLQSFRYDSTTQDPGTSNRTVTFTATDTNSNGNSDTRTISVTAVNDEPTLTATAGNPTFTEGGSAASVFTGSSVSTIESGQTITGLTFTVSNVTNGSNERINVDGSTIVLTHGTSGSTASNSLSYSVSVVGTTATVSLTGGTLSTAAAQTLIDAMSYQNNSDSPDTSDRVVTLTSMQDSGGTANGGDNTVATSIASTVTVVETNDEPTLTATGSDPTFTEGGAAAGLFSGASISTVEPGQTLNSLTFTVTNAINGSNEIVNTDGTAIALTNGTSGTTASNSLSYSVAVSGTTATVSLTGGTLSTAAAQTLVDGMSYQNNSNVPSDSNRVVTLTALQDSGGTANGGDDTASLAVSSTVTVIDVNDEPTLTATASDPTFTEGGSAASVFTGSSASTIESGQTITGLAFTVSNVTNGSNERMNVDGSTIVLTHGTSGSTASNSLSYSVSVVGTTATVSLTGGTLSTAAAQTLVDNMSYQNNADAPDTTDRVVTITNMQDSGGTANGGDDTVSLSLASTVNVVGVNDEPTLTATGSDPTFTEGGAAAGLFSASSASTVESGQTIASMTLTVTNVNNGSDEVLGADGTAIALTDANSGTTASNSLGYSVSVSGTTATVSLSGGAMSTAATQTLVDGLTYQNNSDAPDTTNRVITITALQDSGGTANGGDDTASLSLASTVTIAGVNDEPALTATGSDPTFTEDGAASGLFSASNISTVESGQTVTDLTFTVSNVTDGSNERLNLDGSTVVLTNGTSGTTATNSLSYSVSVSGTTATVALSGGTLSTAAAQTLVDNMSYQNNSNSPNTDNRVVTITSMRDSGGTANGGDDTVTLSITSTVTVVASNDEPTLNATGSNPTFTEGGSAVGLFSGTSVSTVESGQTIAALTLTVTNINDGADEILNADGSAIALTDGNSGTTVSNSLGYSVSVSGTTATVAFSGLTLSTAATQTLVDGLSYRNTNSDNPTGGNRVVTVTSLQDSGGTANGGDDTAALSVASTVTMNTVNDAPTDISLDSTTINQGAGVNGVVGNLSTTDADSISFTYTLVAGSGDADNASFNINGSELRANDAAGMTPGDYNVLINTSDGANNYDEAFTITVVEAVDTDGDGVSDYQEDIDGTDPNDPDDYLDNTAPVITAPAGITLDADALYTAVTLRQLLSLAPGATDTQVQTALDGLATDNIDGSACCNPAPLNMTDNVVRLRPGSNTVTWRATDRKGNTATDTQTVQIRPLVSLSKDQVGVEGGSVSFTVLLNGPAVTYPFLAPFLIDASGSADGADHDLIDGDVTFNAGETRATRTVNLIGGDGVEGDETLVIDLDTGTINAGANTRHTITITENNVAPDVSLGMQQNGIDTVLVVTGDGNVTVTADVTDLNSADTHTYDWSMTDSELMDNDGNPTDGTFVFDPALLTEGVYNMHVFVEDDSMAGDTAELAFRVVTAAPALGTSDSDGDGTDDVTEGFGDSDDDGIPDYLDNIDASNVLPEVAATTNAYLIECDPGVLCRLGRFALAGSTGGARLEQADIDADEDIAEDTDFEHVGGVFDFEIRDLPVAGQNVQVVLPLTSAVPTDAVYRKYQNTLWTTFTEDADNALHSAPGQAGYCPPPGASDWEAGLIEGYHCVQLTIEDGGPNDADGVANGVVKDPGTVATEATTEPEPDPQPDPQPEPEPGDDADPSSTSQITSKVKGGGGAAGGPALLMLALAALFRRRAPARVAGLALLLLSSQVQAMDWDKHLGRTYLELGIYQADGTHTREDVTGGLAGEGIDATISSYDVSRTARQLLAGYAYHDNLAVEAGYLDLGEIHIGLTATTDNPAGLSAALAEHYPVSGDGWTVGHRLSYPVMEKLNASVETALFRWDGDIDLNGAGDDPDLEDGTDPLLGLALKYHFHDRLTAGLQIKRIFFDDQEVDLLGGGLLWRF